MNMAAQSLRANIAWVFQDFYDTYANYLGGDASKYYDKINPKDPSIGIKNCTKLVNKVLSEAQKIGQKPLADIRWGKKAVFILNSP